MAYHTPLAETTTYIQSPFINIKPQFHNIQLIREEVHIKSSEEDISQYWNTAFIWFVAWDWHLLRCWSPSSLCLPSVSTDWLTVERPRFQQGSKVHCSHEEMEVTCVKRGSTPTREHTCRATHGYPKSYDRLCGLMGPYGSWHFNTRHPDCITHQQIT